MRAYKFDQMKTRIAIKNIYVRYYLFKNSFHFPLSTGLDWQADRVPDFDQGHFQDFSQSASSAFSLASAPLLPPGLVPNFKNRSSSCLVNSSRKALTFFYRLLLRHNITGFFN